MLPIRNAISGNKTEKLLLYQFTKLLKLLHRNCIRLEENQRIDLEQVSWYVSVPGTLEGQRRFKQNSFQ